LIDAPYDSALASRYLSMKYGQRPPVAEVRRVFGARLEHDIRAIRAARALVEQDTDESITLSQAACRLSSPECITLGSALIDADREAEAAASYERAFADPALDGVALSNSSDWLVNYYYRQGRTTAALALAERAAGTGAYRGLLTMAHLDERLGRAAAAEDAYRRAATGYDNWSQLIGFYYRAVHVRHEARFEDAWKMALARYFPAGLAPVTTSDTHPDSGVAVINDSVRSRKAGLRAGDIVVGLEGWSVSNYDQYASINAFFDREEVKLTAWRGHLFTVATTAPNRLLGVEYRSYPVRGWAEK
jgi:tetratricopeptide (TPR) repeat protein